MATISLSPTSVNAYDTGAVVTITGSGTAFSGSPFTLTGGYGSVINSTTVTDGTHASINFCVGMQAFATGPLVITVTDTNSGATANLTVVPPNLGSLIVGIIGDSISAGTNGNPNWQVGEIGLQIYLQNWGYTVASTNSTNAAISGSDTSQWQPGSSNLNGALSNFASNGVTLVHVMLGTNDARTPNSFTPAQHHTYMTNIVNTLVGAGYKVIISKPIFTQPNAGLGAGTAVWPNDSATVYQQYFALDAQLCDGINVFIGDTANFSAFQQNPNTLLFSDGVHPADGTANAIIGRNWAVAIIQKFGIPAIALLAQFVPHGHMAAQLQQMFGTP